MPDIVRHDFVDGDETYPPARTGMRGSHPGSFEVAHDLRDGTHPDLAAVPVGERRDLVIVGAGISGLAAAWFYRQARPEATILILDNHDDFGGHAKRNEFIVDGRFLIGYGGSESLQSPDDLYSHVAKGLLRDLGVDVRRFETAFDRELYPSFGLSRGVFFAREAFGTDVLVSGDPMRMVDDDVPVDRMHARHIEEFVADFPVSATSKAALIEVCTSPRDPLEGLSLREKRALLESTSYRDYLVRHWRLGEEAANTFQGRSLDFFALGIDAIPAFEAMETGYPGFAGLQLPPQDDAAAEVDDPYIHHFPDGNASVARLLVRSLIPGAAPGVTMDDIVTSRFDYAALDQADSPIRLRLRSTAVEVTNEDRGVTVAYVRDGVAARVHAGACVLAGSHMMVPYLMPEELPAAQATALAANVKAPLVYVNVAVRDWQSWVRLGVHEITNPMGFFSRVKLDYPVSLGDYRCARSPEEPIVLHLVHVPAKPNRGLDARSQHRAGRNRLLKTSFEEFETKVRDELTRILGPGGFDADRDIAAITVNRWPHGYSYGGNTLFDEPSDPAPFEVARRRVGQVVIANADAAWDAFTHAAIDQAHRAVGELLG